MSRVLYAVYGIAVLAFAAYAQSTGKWLPRPARNQVVPASIRDNPGAYRPVYRSTYGTFRGK